LAYSKYTLALLEVLEAEPGLRHELIFYSTFAHKTYGILQRKERLDEGFSRLQQTFQDAVERVRAIVRTAGDRGFQEAKVLLELSPKAFSELLGLMHDLAIIKQQ